MRFITTNDRGSPISLSLGWALIRTLTPNWTTLALIVLASYSAYFALGPRDTFWTSLASKVLGLPLLVALLVALWVWVMHTASPLALYLLLRRHDTRAMLVATLERILDNDLDRDVDEYDTYGWQRMTSVMASAGCPHAAVIKLTIFKHSTAFFEPEPHLWSLTEDNDLVGSYAEDDDDAAPIRCSWWTKRLMHLARHGDMHQPIFAVFPLESVDRGSAHMRLRFLAGMQAHLTRLGVDATPSPCALHTA